MLYKWGNRRKEKDVLVLMLQTVEKVQLHCSFFWSVFISQCAHYLWMTILLFCNTDLQVFYILILTQHFYLGYLDEYVLKKNTHCADVRPFPKYFLMQRASTCSGIYSESLETSSPLPRVLLYLRRIALVFLHFWLPGCYNSIFII